MKLLKTSIAAVLVLPLSACNPLESLCDGRVASAMQSATRSSYKDGFSKGAAAALQCIEKEGGKPELALERCRKRIR